MELLVFRTDIKTKESVGLLKPFLDRRLSIIDWCVDLEDIDNVLRIEAMDDVVEGEIIALAKSEGFYCEPLPD